MYLNEFDVLKGIEHEMCPVCSMSLQRITYYDWLCDVCGVRISVDREVDV